MLLLRLLVLASLAPAPVAAPAPPPALRVTAIPEAREDVQ
jgi:hypothetical protein